MKLTRKVSIAALLSVGSMVMLPMAAQATCYLTGPIVRVTQYDDAYSSTGCYIYMKTSSLSSYYYYTNTSDDNICNSAVSAVASQVNTGVSGNASACPSTTGYMGATNYLIINP